MSTNAEIKLARLRSRLDLAYAAEAKALECQNTSNAEGEQNAVASLSSIRALITDLEKQVDDLTITSPVTMFWKMPI